ncbi:MAG: ABC transporter permease [Candidatus Micrarchaeota archaeon]|nr:ABC transporter permease [Candidatus Micrarchaeota archaeon]MDE1834761.1 ABC transporter permease [Candidatus Micrarchaeota archaeon]MDE1859756.1 ABC transporter permease [Candidatus Micrarchaeota archaeon]
MGYNAIYVLWLRDMKRFLRAKSRIIGMLMMPIFFLLGLGLGLGSLIHLAGGTSYLDFIVPGIIGMSLLFVSIFTGSAVLWDRQFGFLKEILITPNSRTSIVIGRIVGGGTTALLQSILVVAISLLIGFQIQFSALTILAVVFMALIAATFISLGLTLGSMISDFQGFQLVTSFFTMPLFFLSDSIFPASALPPYVRFITYLNPLTYGVDGLRNALIGIGTFSIWTDLLAMIISTVIMVSIATYAFSKTEAG